MVLRADPTWAREQADTGTVIVLNPLTPDEGGSVIALHSRLTERAPDVVNFLRLYRFDKKMLDKEAAEIGSGFLG